MSKETIAERCKNLISIRDKEREEVDQQYRISVQESALLEKWEKIFTLHQLYIWLEEELNTSFAQEGNFLVMVDPSYTNFLDIKEMCGLNIDRHAHGLVVNLRASHAAKKCTISLGINSKRKTLTLDFPKLVEEIKQQDELLEENVYGLAQHYLECLNQALKTAPDRHYGITNPFKIRIDGKEDAQIGTRKIPLKYLLMHDSDIYKKMNNYISFGKITNMYTKDDGLYVSIEPSKNIAAWPIVNYKEFCEAYSVVTPELQAVFNNIADGLQPLPVEKHYVHLDIRHWLFYSFQDEHSLHKLCDSLEQVKNHDAFYAALASTIEEKLKIEVQGMHFHNERLYVHYKPLANQSEPELYHDITITEIKATIHEMKSALIPTVVDSLAHHALDIVDDYIKKGKISDINRKTVDFPHENLIFKTDQYEIDISKTDFIVRNTITEAIKTQTGKLVDFDYSLQRVSFNLVSFELGAKGQT